MNKSINYLLLPAYLLIATVLLVVGVQQAKAADADLSESNIEALQQQEVSIDRNIFTKRWNKTPYNTKIFSYTNAQLKDKWEYMLRGLKMPYPTIEFITYVGKHYPEVMEGVAPELANNPAKFQAATLDAMRDFFAGKFQSAYKKGQPLGVIGEEISSFAETIYANYLTTRQSVKYMMLQDVVNTVSKRDRLLEKMAKDPNEAVRANAAFAYLGYAYSLARIAEESPIPVVLARGYLETLQHAADQVLTIYPNHPLGLAFRAALDANILRRVGKFNGRLVYNASTAVAIEDFEKSINLVPDQAITQYEFANALIYLDQKRQLNKAMRHLETAIKSKPSFSMEALDSMYAYKRLQEVRLYALDYRSFHRFDKDRRNFIDVTDRNLNNVSAPNLTRDMLKNPEKYKL